jgi:hypothetical protein
LRCTPRGSNPARWVCGTNAVSSWLGVRVKGEECPRSGSNRRPPVYETGGAVSCPPHTFQETRATIFPDGAGGKPGSDPSAWVRGRPLGCSPMDYEPAASQGGSIMTVSCWKRAWKALAAALRGFGLGRGARPSPSIQASPGPISAATPAQEPAPGSPPWLAALARQLDRLAREVAELSAELEELDGKVRELRPGGEP